MIEGTVPIAGPLAPTAETDTYPSHIDAYGKGGYRAVADATARDAIPAARRTAGMMVRLLDTGVTYILGVDLLTWTEVSFGGGGGLTWEVVTGDTLAVAGHGYFIDASAAPVTLTMPGGPVLGDPVGAVAINVTYPVTVARNGNLLMGEASDLTLDRVGDGVELRYSGATFGWTPVSELGSGASPDSYALRARWPLNPKDYGAIGDGTSHPLSASSMNDPATGYASLEAAQADYPHATALTNEIDWAATQLCLNMADAQNRSVWSPGGIYLCDQTLVVGVGVMWRGDGAWAVSYGAGRTEFKATTNDMLLCKLTTLSTLHDLGFNGNQKAIWGMMVQGNRPQLHSITVYNCTEAGICLDATQNGGFHDISTHYNKYGLLLRNGARNNSFYGVYATADKTWYWGDYAAARWMVLALRTGDEHGFGATDGSAITAFGNDRSHFYGGIIENYNICIETENPAGYALTTHNRSDFFGIEFTGTPDSVGSGAIFKFDSTFMGTMLFYGCWLGINDPSGRLGVGPARCKLWFDEACQINSGNTTALRGLYDIPSNLLSSLKCNSSDETDPSYLTNSPFYKSGTVSFDAAKKQFSVSGNTSYLAAVVEGVMSWQAGASGGITFSQMKITLRVKFTVDEVVGGLGVVEVSRLLQGSPWHEPIARVGVGAWEFVHTVSTLAPGQEGGGFSFRCYYVCDSFKISSIKIEVA